MKKNLCLILFFLVSFVSAKPSQEVIEEKDWSWLKDENLVKEKKKQSEELMDKYLYDYSQENISITIQKCLFKKNTIKIFLPKIFIF